MLARALEGSHHLESDAAQVLSAFARVVDGCKDYLWPLLNEAVKAAESYAGRLAPKGTATSAAAPRQPASRQAEPNSEPPVIPPERIEELRPPVVPGAGQKTRGYWISANGTTHPVVSGDDDANAQLRDVPILLPEGSTLTVHGTTEQGEHISRRYTGGARPWWR